MSFDYQLETKLKREAPNLHTVFSNNVICSQNMLLKYKAIFPDFTDHTSLHSLEVIAFCNELIGENIDKLNTDEIFILLMSAYLHDSGMGISLDDFEQFSKELPMVEKFRQENPDVSIAETVRRFHNEFSGRYIYKYADFFDFPSEKYLFAVVEASRGHRKTDLFDENEYPSELKLDNGNVVHLPYIASLIRLADELDIAADRNIQFLYDTTRLTKRRDILEFKKHKAIKTIKFQGDSLIANVDFSDEEIRDELYELFEKLNQTLLYCKKVIETRTQFKLDLNFVKIHTVI